MSGFGGARRVSPRSGDERPWPDTDDGRCVSGPPAEVPKPSGSPDERGAPDRTPAVTTENADAVVAIRHSECLKKK
jgi:hypothetical protein